MSFLPAAIGVTSDALGRRAVGSQYYGSSGISANYPGGKYDSSYTATTGYKPPAAATATPSNYTPSYTQPSATTVAKVASPDYSAIQSGMDKQYDYQRTQAAQQENAQRQTDQDALARRSAQLGGGPGGALVNQEQLINNQSAQRLNQADEAIGQQQAADNRNLQATKLGQEFQSGLQQQSLQQQANEQAQGLQAQEEMQKAGLGQQAALQTAEQNFQGQLAANQMGQSWAQFRQQASQQDNQFQQQLGFSQKQFDEQTGVDQFNEKIAQQMADKKDVLETLFGNFSTGSIASGLGAVGSNGIGGVSGGNAVTGINFGGGLGGDGFGGLKF